MATAKKKKKKTVKKTTKKPAKKKKASAPKAAKKKAAKKKAVKKPAKKKAAKKKTAKKKPASKKAPKKKAAKKKPAKKNAATKKAAKAKTKKTAGKQVKPKAKITPKPKVTKKTTVVLDLEGLFTPLDDRLIVQYEAVSETTAGGIIIPGSVSAERPNTGKVLAVGRGHLNPKGKIRPMDVQVGDQVLFSKYSGNSIIMGEAEVLVMREGDILGIVD